MLGSALLTQIYDKIHDSYHGFSNMASEWLAAVLAANQKADLKIDNYHRCYHGIALPVLRSRWYRPCQIPVSVHSDICCRGYYSRTNPMIEGMTNFQHIYNKIE